ncbi:MAG: uracil-DNA glycosylase [Oscillospiraceae bacterium]|nr:uracil-DNA glycosylase [Oscillospiraceae bacterium]
MDWEMLSGQCSHCQRCRLSETRTQAVFGVGPANTPILFVGEGPGRQEDLQGEPFVGPAGQLLDEMLSIIDLSRQNCYITNVVKCRPPRNRDPLPEEEEACLPFLRMQYRLLRPKLVICLGRIAAASLIHEDYHITREHGQWVQKGSVFMTAIYHPSALLRDPSKRPETFRDLLLIRDKIREVCPDFYRNE